MPEYIDKTDFSLPHDRKFITASVLKRDVFSQTHLGYFEDEPDTKVIRRIVTAAPWWSRPLAWILARREIKALKRVRGIEGVPQLLYVDRDGLYRSWSEGTPLHLARPDNKKFYETAHHILRQLRQRGVTHNDLAKPQNWLMTPEGTAAIIDFQLASIHKKRNALYRYFSYEDFRHLIKQKRSFANELMTPREKKILRTRSWPSKLWLATGKKVYNFITRRIFNWSDGEGTGDRLQIQGPLITEILEKDPNIDAVALTLYSLPSKGVGLYLFVETQKLGEKAIRNRLKGQKIEKIQPVAQIPRCADGSVRDDIMRLIAMNQITELEELLQREPHLRDMVTPIVDNRLNFTDRRVHALENPM